MQVIIIIKIIIKEYNDRTLWTLISYSIHCLDGKMNSFLVLKKKIKNALIIAVSIA